MTMRLNEMLVPDLKKQDLWQLFDETEMHLVPVY